MSVGDNMKKIFTDAAKAAVQKSNEVIETAKSKYSEFDIQNSIDGMYKKLGKLVYEGYKNDEDVTASITGICEEIAKKTDELANLKSKGEAFSYSIICPACSKACEPECLYCPHCGEKLS